MGWAGGHVNVPCTSYVICCYTAEISGDLAAVIYTKGWDVLGGVGEGAM